MRPDFALAFLGAAALLFLGAPARAVDVTFDGFTDFRLVAPADERSWIDGGLGKTRYGDSNFNFQFGDAYGQATVLFTPELIAVAVARADDTQKDFVLPMEGWLRYRPVSTTPWRWSVKAGAFFAPFSLENTEVGWTSHWTLTPSAINSWFGDELRTIGGEGTLEWRREEGTLSVIGSLFGWNEPAGVLMADRGWTLEDRPTALFDDVRLPDATLVMFGAPYPDSTVMFDEIDHRAGWYAGADWSDADDWRLQFFRYDNEADPAAHRNDYFAWRTDFWDVGFSKTWQDFTLLAQGLTGETIITPFPGFTSITEFDSAYGLLGWERDDWRVAARGDWFRTHTGGNAFFSEDGYALTFAATWVPKDWLRLTGEILYVDSSRDERTIEGLAPNQSDTQGQLSVRFYL